MTEVEKFNYAAGIIFMGFMGLIVGGYLLWFLIKFGIKKLNRYFSVMHPVFAVVHTLIGLILISIGVERLHRFIMSLL